jgi:4-hydroxy-2-oxoglutarate aldolase
MSAMTLTGVFAPLPTPFQANGELDTRRLRDAIGQWTATPLSGFIVLGSNGEAVFLDEEESDRVIATAREAVPTSRPLVIGAGRESTRATIRATKRAADLGADFVLVRTPGFFKSQMTNDAFVRHYTAVADESPVPVLLYNFTAVTGVNLLPAAVARLATHPNIVGMKESGGDVAQIADLVTGTPKQFAVLAGTTSTFYAALCVGCVGGILAPACVVPQLCVRLFELTRAGQHEAARALQAELIPLARLLGPTYGVPGLKAALKLAGYDVGFPRSPLAPVPDEAVAAMRQALARLEQIEGANVSSPR